jgi:small-conductance mechanosensitive channel
MLRARVALSLSALILFALCAAIFPGAAMSEPAGNAAGTDTVAAADESSSQVLLDGKPLFVVPSSQRAQTRQDRAQKVSEQIQALAGDRSLGLDTLRLREVPALEETQIVAGNKVIISISEQDAQTVGKSRGIIAHQYMEVIKDALATHREEYAPGRMLEGAAKSGAATLVLLLGLRILNWLYRLLRLRSDKFYGFPLPTLRLGRREVIHPEQIKQLTGRLLMLLRLVVSLGLVSIYLNFVLASFPQTRSISVGILESVLSSVGQLFQGFFSYLPKLIFLAVLAWVTFYAFKLLRFVFREIEEGGIVIQGFEPDWVMPTSRIAYFLLLALVGIIAFPYLPGAGSDAFQGISIFLGILISFGSSSAITNMISGILLTYTRAFRIGDKVSVADVTGIVVEKGLMVTRLLTDTNHYVSIPNGTVTASNVINYRIESQKERGLHPPPILSLLVDLPFAVPWQRAHQIILEAAQQSDLLLRNPPPLVLHHAFHPNHVTYELSASTNNHNDEAVIRSELLQGIRERCEGEGISLLIPKTYALPGAAPATSGAGSDAPGGGNRRQESGNAALHSSDGQPPPPA